MADNNANLDRHLTFCASKGVTERGLDIVREVITQPPARRVQSRSMSSNHTVRFPSRKMGVAIQAESLSLEWSSLYIKEFDDSVRGFWDQPFHRPNLVYKSKNRTVRTSVTLDFFVISEDFIGFEECKPEAQLVAEISKPSDRYKYDEHSRTYTMPSLENYLAGTGLGHRLFTDLDVNPTLVMNLDLLYDLLDEPVNESDEQLWSVARQLISAKGAMRLEELESEVKGLDRTSLLVAICRGELFIDLHKDDLRAPERVPVYANAGSLEARHKRISRVELGASELSGSPEDMAQALTRLEAVQSVSRGMRVDEVALDNGVSARTVQRWMKAYREGGLRGLEPRNRDKGNYGSKLDHRVEAHIHEVLNEYYMTSEAKTPTHVYGILKELCKDSGLRPPSREAFFLRLNEVDDRRRLKVREGAKRAYQVTAYSGAETDKEYAFRGVSRFLERCHIDHTLADIVLLSDEGGVLGKPWLTIITDEHSGFVLAGYLSFQNPSTVAVMSALRLMVFRHGVFPETIVVDGGKEFESTYFETFMARRRCSIISRKGKPRSGHAVERQYGTTNTVFLDNLTGNNKQAKFVRQLSSTHNPENLAIWKAFDFHQAYHQFIDEWNCKSAKSGGMSPEQIKQHSMSRFGIRKNRVVKYDEDFLRDVLPASKRQVKIRRNQHIQVNRVRYWHPCLRGATSDGVYADVRYDPFDLNYVYVYYNKRWLKFSSSNRQHGRFDELEAAFVAEVARESLAVNEKAASEARSGFAVSVELLDRQAKARASNFVADASDNLLESTDFTGECSAKDNHGADIWAIEIPGSVEID